MPSSLNITLQFPSLDTGAQAWVQDSIGGLVCIYIFKKFIFFPWNEISNNPANHSICPQYNSQNMIVSFKCIIEANPLIGFLITF